VLLHYTIVHCITPYADITYFNYKSYFYTDGLFTIVDVGELERHSIGAVFRTSNGGSALMLNVLQTPNYKPLLQVVIHFFCVSLMKLLPTINI